jgi:hypothetical protein
MALTIITTRSDNGNKFLCPDCSRSFRRSGTQKQEEVFCLVNKQPVPFLVTQCDYFLNKCFDQDTAPVEAMKKAAWVMEARKGVLTFTPPEGRRMLRRYARARRSAPNPGKALIN